MRIRRILLLFILLFVIPLSARAQDEDHSEIQDHEREAQLTVHINPSRPSQITLWISAKVQNREEVERSLLRSFSFPIRFVDLSAQYPEDFHEEEDETIIFAEADPFQSAKIQGVINPEPLIAPLQSQNLERLGVWVQFGGLGYDVRLKNPGNSNEYAVLNRRYLNIDLRAPGHDAIAFEAGYTRGELLKQSAPLIIFLIVPALLTLGRSIWAPKFYKSPGELWARHLRFTYRLINLLWPVWICVFSFSELPYVFRFVVPRWANSHALDLLFYFAPPLVAMFLCHLASRGIYRRVTGVPWSPSEIMRRAMVTSIFSLGPFLLVILILNTLSTDPRRAALYAALGYFAWLLLRHVFAKSFGPKLHALTSGDLRDRIFELAQKAGVALKQIYVLPEERAQLSNAFAASDDSVMITTSLLKNLSRREVDSIMAHEVGHLQAKHPRRAMTTMVIAIVIVQIVGTSFAMFIGIANVVPIVFTLSLACASLVLFFLSRRNEHQADAIGISLTEDPEAFISGLAKLSRLNLMPLHSGGWSESLETHPSTMRRLQGVAKKFGISDERFETLISDSFASTDTYPAVDEEQAEAVIFSSDFKAKYTLRIGLILLVTVVVGPLPFAIILGHERVSGLWLVVACVVGFIAWFAIYQIVRNAVAFSGHRSLGRSLRMKLEKRGLTEVARAGTLIGLAPAADSRKYENYSFWDIGLLWLTEDRLYYFGEQTEFSLSRTDVQSVYIEDAAPEWLPEKNLFLTWQEGNEAAKQTLHFVAVGERSVLNGRRAIESLHRRLDEWRKQPHDLPATPAEFMTVAEPRFPEITSVPAVKTFRPGPFVKVAFKFAFYGVVIGFALGLSWLSIGYMGLAVFIGTLFDELPKAFSRKDRKPSTDYTDCSA